MTVPSDLVSFCAGVELTSANYSSGPKTFADMVGEADDWLLEGAASPTHVGTGSEEGVDFSVGTIKITSDNIPILAHGSIIAVFDASHTITTTENVLGRNTAKPASSFGDLRPFLLGSTFQRIKLGTYLLQDDGDFSAAKANPMVIAVGWNGDNFWSKINDNDTVVGSPVANNHLSGWSPVALSIGAYNDTEHFDGDVYSVYFFAEDIYASNDVDALNSALMTRYGIS